MRDDKSDKGHVRDGLLSLVAEYMVFGAQGLLFLAALFGAGILGALSLFGLPTKELAGLVMLIAVGISVWMFLSE